MLTAEDVYKKDILDGCAHMYVCLYDVYLSKRKRKYGCICCPYSDFYSMVSNVYPYQSCHGHASPRGSIDSSTS